MRKHEMARMRQVVILMMILMVGAISSTVLWSGSKTSLYEVQAAETTNNRTVKVGYYIAPGFQEYDESTGVYSGSSYEYLMVLKQYTGWQYEFVPVEFSSSSYQNGTRVVAKFAPMDYYFAVPKEQQNLLSELNSAMERIQTDMPDLLQNLEKRYEFRYNETNVVLTEAEKKYIEENPVVTVAVSDAWYPISYFNDKGQYTGPLAEIYQRISDATGIKFEYRKYDHYAQALEAVKNREVDMISEFPYDFLEKWIEKQ